MGIEKDVGVGVGVGLSDLAFVYPLAVLACRREAGMSFGEAVRAGRLWSGATTQLSLIPYSIMVEAGTKWIRKEVEVSPVVAAACISTIVSIGLQPIEKKLVIDQLLQSNKSSSKGFLGPFQDILQYGKTNGVRQLYKGFVPLAAREFIYIAAISVVNPLIVSMVDHQLNSFQHRTVPEAFGAFSVGFCAGMISAPCQTVNAMMKDERNKYKSLSTLLKDNIFGNGFQSGTKRLFFGAATRSARCGGAGVLYYTWRNILAATD